MDFCQEARSNQRINRRFSHYASADIRIRDGQGIIAIQVEKTRFSTIIPVATDNATAFETLITPKGVNPKRGYTAFKICTRAPTLAAEKDRASWQFRSKRPA